jgi:2-oxoglutarate ferredoxin oxidoreductase subunit gamma
MSNFYEEIIVAGFGGQGIILSGKLLAQTAMTAGREVTYMPSYGAEVRGGTANCMVVIADEPIASPIITNPHTLITMNKASLDKFGPRVKDSGLIILNSSLIDIEPETADNVRVIKVPADELAVELGSPRSANMVILGAYMQATGIFPAEQAADCLKDVLAKRHHKTLPVNTAALKSGAEYVTRNTLAGK